MILYMKEVERRRLNGNFVSILEHANNLEAFVHTRITDLEQPRDGGRGRERWMTTATHERVKGISVKV